VNRFSKELNLKVHRIFLGQDFLDVVANPTHGYGSQMNPCIDCRILMFREAKEIAEKIGADFIVTGEVLDERPFSQRRKAMLLIEKEAGLEGKILRPLSAKLLPESEPEKKGLVRRDRLLAIRGRRRLPQMKLAKELGIRDYPNPSGGCLLTDPRFAQRVREHLKYEKKLRLVDVALLKVGRHFRVDAVKVIVGRNEAENGRLLTVSKSRGIPYLETVNYKGPITLYIGEERLNIIRKAASITVRYSDAPRDVPVRVLYRSGKEKIMEIEATAMKEEELENLRV
jgi:tRNA U34 2-thiouridine synthase MnmA/TrmU